ncbi:hypothetical protein YW3DRAFT_02929 [Streptomyces sp. MnatMP-M77]|uniref:hypothetical protein n=1 Tax=Streptomyces TaxID=1883 RepID=UPI0001C1B46E|nr:MULTISPECIES: hypothetical protein [unclassified Streptomyces]EGE43055.1 hypothetical protein SACT1_3720 [Streptomyces sp. ACT-1]SBV06952.1 hypothetical protein YW3DRAFT_02929 [Streptomyces sp. MnatMP-M77]
MVGAQLRETAQELAVLLWREHTVYRERSGGMVIRGEHVRRWISLAPAGGRDEILVRAGRILDGGTTAPARSEAVVPLSAGTGVLAAACRRLLADAAADAARPAPDRAASGRTRRPRRSRGSARRNRRGRHTGLGSWVIIVFVAGLIALFAYTSAMHG